MTKNISIIDSQEVPEITKKVSGAKLSQVAQAVNIVISGIPKAPLMEFAQLQKKSKLRELVDIAERAHHFGSLKRAMSPEDYEIAMAEAAKQVKPFIRAIPFGARDLERIQHIQYEMPSRVDLAMSKRVQSSPEEIARSQRNEADRVRMKMHEDFRKFGGLKSILGEKQFTKVMAEAAKKVEPFKKMRGSKGSTHDENGNSFYGIDPNPWK